MATDRFVRDAGMLVRQATDLRSASSNGRSPTGARRRLFTGATRRAVQVAVQECFHPTCETPAEDCEADHIVPYSEGGPTVTRNGQPACGFHNRLEHRKHGTG